MSDVFISYSRQDIDFVRHLFDQLQAHDREPWADWQDIPPTADWLAEMDRNPERSLILAVESVKSTYEFDRTVLPLSNTALRQSIIESKVRLTLKSHKGGLTSARYSQD